MSLTDQQRNAIHDLWDELADFPASQADASLTHLMDRLAAWLKADDIVWVGAARLGRGAAARRDPQHGWRGLAIRHHKMTPEILARSQYAVRVQGTSPDLTSRALIAGAGRLRIHRLHDGFVDLRAMKRTENYRILYEEAGIVDRMFAGVPVNADAESFVLIDRYGGGDRFTVEEADCVELTMRGLKWFHRELLLANGLLLAGAPFSATERRIVRLLLTDRSEKEIAAELGQSPKTTHKYVTEIFRKYGVKGRTGLMALWLGRGGGASSVVAAG